MAGKPDGTPEDRDPLAYIPSLGDTSPRKRRSDATGRKQTDYHGSSVTLAVRVTEDLAAWVRDQAKSAGLSTNAWLKDLLERERGDW